MVCTIYVCYVMRGGNDERRDELNKCLMAKANLSADFKAKYTDFTRAFETVTAKIMDDLKKANAIPPETSANRALRENMFTLTICIDANIPLMIIGKPGTSKTLSMSILRNLLNQDQKRDSKYYKDLPHFTFQEFYGS